MELYNHIIKSTMGLTGNSVPRRFPYDSSTCWPETDSFELIMSRDAAYELGGSNLPAANFTCVTSDPSLIPDDEILVYGPDIAELKKDSPYARIALIQVAEDLDKDKTDTDAVCHAVQNIDFVKYHTFPQGFMARTSAMDNREQVRISKQAIKDGISFARIGSTFIRRYHMDPLVKKVRLIFITAPDADYQALRKCAKDTAAVTRTLSKIMEGMPTDCHSCTLKPICDEVEGMKELHFKKAKS